MTASATYVDESDCQIVCLPVRTTRRQHTRSLRVMLRQLDATHLSADLAQAEVLIAAIYARSDQVRMSNIRDGATL